MSWLDEISWNTQGLVPAIAQDHVTGKILMMAWMNKESLQLTMQEGRAIYWSRSRGKLWRKGEESGNVQELKELRLDCDGDVVLLSPGCASFDQFDNFEHRGDVFRELVRGLKEYA